MSVLLTLSQSTSKSPRSQAASTSKSVRTRKIQKRHAVHMGSWGAVRQWVIRTPSVKSPSW